MINKQEMKSSADVFCVCADLKFKNGLFEDAIDDLNKALAMDPNCVAAYYRLGNIYLNLQRYNESEEQYKKILSVNGKNSDAYVGLGKFSCSLGNYEKSERFIRLAMELNRKSAKPYYALGELEARRESYDKSVVAYQLALVLDSSFVNTSLKKDFNKIVSNLESKDLKATVKKIQSLVAKF